MIFTLRRLSIFALVCVLALSALAVPTSAVAAADDRSFNVYLVNGTEVTNVTASFGYSVRDVLDIGGFELHGNHRRSPVVLRPANPGQIITLSFDSASRHTVHEEIPYQTVRVAHSLFAEGQVIRVNYGSAGLRDATYANLHIDGELIGEAIVSEVIHTEPVHAKVLVGTPGARISPINLNWERCENGLPVNYVRRMSNQRATAYSRTCAGLYTSTGMPVAVGLVAVNPRVIPYGSLLYIRSACGVFNYGYALAADTGGDLMRGVIDIDLFYNTRFEAIQHGSRRVEIFVLRTP